MKSNQQNAYDKYMQEVWDIKEDLYKDFLKSGCASYVEFIQEQTRHMHKVYYVDRKSRQQAA